MTTQLNTILNSYRRAINNSPPVENIRQESLIRSKVIVAFEQFYIKDLPISCSANYDFVRGLLYNRLRTQLSYFSSSDFDTRFGIKINNLRIEFNEEYNDIKRVAILKGTWDWEIKVITPNTTDNKVHQIVSCIMSEISVMGSLRNYLSERYSDSSILAVIRSRSLAETSGKFASIVNSIKNFKNTVV